MINSLFILGSAYNKSRVVSIFFILGWIAYMFIGSDLSLGILFPIINLIVFLLVSISINLIKNRKINTILSIFSILIWSIIIDLICYFLFPSISGNQNMLAYIFQGILFNGKYVFSNAIMIGGISIIDYIIKNTQNKVKINEYLFCNDKKICSKLKRFKII